MLVLCSDMMNKAAICWHGMAWHVTHVSRQGHTSADVARCAVQAAQVDPFDLDRVPLVGSR